MTYAFPTPRSVAEEARRNFLDKYRDGIEEDALAIADAIQDAVDAGRTHTQLPACDESKPTAIDIRRYNLSVLFKMGYTKGRNGTIHWSAAK